MSEELTTRVIRAAVAGVAIVGATVLACYDKDGWGWLIFIAFLIVMGL